MNIPLEHQIGQIDLDMMILWKMRKDAQEVRAARRICSGYIDKFVERTIEVLGTQIRGLQNKKRQVYSDLLLRECPKGEMK